MKYYKVVSNKLRIAFYDSKTKQTLYTKDNIYSFRYKNGLRYSFQYIPDELITEKELAKYYGITPENITLFPFLQPVEISKKKTHFTFGVRFADGHNWYYTQNGIPVK